MLDWVWRCGASRASVQRSCHRSRSTARSHEGEIAIDIARLRSTAWSRKASITISRSVAPIAISAVLREIAISDRGRRTGAREIGANWSSGFAGNRRTGLELGLLPLPHSLSLSLSFSRNTLKWKWKCKMISVVKAIFFSVNGNQFPENSIFRTNQTPPFPEKHFRKWFSPKINTPQAAKASFGKWWVFTNKQSKT